MRRRWVIPVMVALLVAGPATNSASAETPAPGGPEAKPEEAPVDSMTSDIELTRAAIQVRRQAIVTAAMDLEPREAEGFWSLYRQYRLDMQKVNDRYVKLLLAYAEHHDSLSDAMAAQILKEYLGIERDRTGIKARYLDRFGKVMPPRKVMRFFQVDNKLDAFINAELATQIPLAR
jgi:hypothetical protein